MWGKIKVWNKSNNEILQVFAQLNVLVIRFNLTITLRITNSCKCDTAFVKSQGNKETVVAGIRSQETISNFLMNQKACNIRK